MNDRYHNPLTLNGDRSVRDGSFAALAESIRRAADLRIATEFRHNEHIDTTSSNPELVREVAEFRVTYLLDDRWSAGIMSFSRDGQQLGSFNYPGTWSPQPLRVRIGSPRNGSGGELPVGGAWINYNLRYYLVAITFVVFDVEIAFVYPVATIFKDWIAAGKGWTAFIEIMIFALILFVGLLYVWVKGDLRWFKNVTVDTSTRRVTPEEATTI